MDWVSEIADAWKREYPELETTSLPPLVRVARLGVLIEGFQRAVLEPFELTDSDYRVLAMLRRAGQPYQLSPSQLYSRLQRSSGGMTKMLKRLEQRELVARKPDPEDGRGLLVALTPRGLRLQERVFHAYVLASQDLFADFGARDRQAADATLVELVEAFERFLRTGEEGA